MLACCKLPCVCFAPARPRPPCFGRAADSHSAWPWALAVAVGSLLDLVPCTRVLCGDCIQTPYATKGCAHLKVYIVGCRPKESCDHGPGSRLRNTGPLVDVGRSRLLLASPAPKTSAVNNEKNATPPAGPRRAAVRHKFLSTFGPVRLDKQFCKQPFYANPWAAGPTQRNVLILHCVLILGAKLQFSRCHPTSCLEEGAVRHKFLGTFSSTNNFFQEIFFFGSAGGGGGAEM